ncbi:hypothetical protein, partial [Klebsiella pneumoniae]|uniref:hypothetical protein n=1 Tax=Klebsiella pneumoniae TaxID=573 RepID=UPI0039696479
AASSAEGRLAGILQAHSIAYAKDNGISINQQGDWARGQARTLYLDSPQSPDRFCLHQQGYAQVGLDPDSKLR